MDASIRNPDRPPARRARLVLRATLALAVVWGAIACSTTDRRTEEERAADQALTQQVRDALRADQNLYDAQIEVKVRGGVVWLTGFVTSANDARAARRVSAAVPGVRRVVDQIDLADWTAHF